jgi:hypothetical protein
MAVDKPGHYEAPGAINNHVIFRALIRFRIDNAKQMVVKQCKLVFLNRGGARMRQDQTVLQRYPGIPEDIPVARLGSLINQVC